MLTWLSRVMENGNFVFDFVGMTIINIVFYCERLIVSLSMFVFDY
jgi:hypothetical protein